MRRSQHSKACLLSAGLLAGLLASCGGGGGGGATAGTPLRLQANPVVVGATASIADLVVALPSSTATPALLEVGIVLPPALAIASTEPLQSQQALVTLDGDWVGGRYKVVAGDARNQSATTLTSGPLFRLRLQATNPRQVGTHTVQLVDLVMARSDGTAVAVDNNPLTVSVTLQ